MTDIVFTDDAVFLMESLGVMVMVLKVLHEGAKSLELTIPLTKTNVHSFKILLDDTIQSVHASDADAEVTNSLIYQDSVMQTERGAFQEITRRIGLVHGITDSLKANSPLNTSIWRC